MPKQIAPEIRADRNREEEQEKLKKKCRSCDSKNIFLVKYDKGLPTQNIIASCTNTTCWNHVDLTVMDGSWKQTNAAA